MEANVLAKATSARGAMDEYDKVQYMPSIDLPKIQQVEVCSSSIGPNNQQ